MAYSYLYIDDNTATNAAGIISGLGDEVNLVIEFDNPTGTWEGERKRVASEKFKEFNGLILDLNLEEIPNAQKLRSQFKGSSLAQEIRNLAKAGEIAEIPIILLSGTANLEKYFDKTNEDLFDLIIAREDLTDIFVPIRNKLIALSEGYGALGICKKDRDLNRLFDHDVSREDIRFVSEMNSVVDYAVHTISNFLIKHFLEKSGIVIDERLLATRLGIDLSSEDWIVVLGKLEDCKYRGVYSQGWVRWWMSDVEKWWLNTISSKHNLRTLTGKERVMLISEAFALKNLKAIEKDEKSRSESFWTNCVGSNVPIDTIDGLLISNQDNLFSWQDKKYISFSEALKPVKKNAWKKISPLEEFKLNQLKAYYPNERPKPE